MAEVQGVVQKRKLVLKKTAAKPQTHCTNQKLKTMGLDMYLKKKTYVGAKWEHRNVTGEVKVTLQDKELPIRFKRISIIEEEVGYWRKANQIHRWFVENVQKGVDDCGEYYVTLDNLKQLLEDCKNVKQSITNAPEVMPTVSGFFFGNTDYDEYYWQDIDDTIAFVEAILQEESESDTQADYYYHSSW